MKKEFKWTLSSGKEAKIVAEYAEILETEILNVDGYKIEGEKKPTINSKLTAYVDDKQVDSCNNSDFWCLVDVNGVKKIWGMKIGFNNLDIAAEYEKFISKVKETGKSTEVKQYEKDKEAEQQAETIEIAKQIILRAERQKNIPTAEEAKRIKMEYNRIYNEGGDGYVPEIISIEQYNWAKSIING